MIGRIHTVSYLALMDYLEHYVKGITGKEPKKANLIIKKAKFTFNYSADEHSLCKNVIYEHSLLVTGKNRSIDIVIMHTPGKIVRQPEDYSAHLEGAYILYQDKKYSIVPVPIIGDVRNQNNQIFDRIRKDLYRGDQNDEWIKICYQNWGGGDLDDDSVFVIYPRNYGKRFKGEAKFEVNFDEPYNATIELKAIPYDCLIDSNMRSLGSFEVTEDKMHYVFRLKKVNVHFVYFVMIRNNKNITSL